MEPQAVELIRKKIDEFVVKRRLSFFVLAASIGSQVLAVFLVVFRSTGNPVLFLLEFHACIIASISLEIAGFCVRKVVVFRAVHLIRFGIIVLVIILIEDGSVDIPALLMVPFLAESVLYDSNRIAVGANVGFLLITVIIFAVQLWPGGVLNAVLHVGGYAVITGLSATFACLLVMYREDLVEAVTRIKNLNATVVNLSDANKAFQLYADNIESQTAEKERQRITRELHDTVGYALTNVIVMMNAAKVLVREDSDSLDAFFDRIRNQSEEALNETRQILYRLRNIQVFNPKGLQAISQLIHSFQGATNINIELNLGNLPWTLGQLLDTALYRLVQEGLTNSFRHGKATKVTINMWRSDEEIRVSIRDNGRGTGDEPPMSDGIGLSGMRERFASLGGTILHHNVADGYELKASIPYKMERIVGTHQSTDS